MKTKKLVITIDVTMCELLDVIGRGDAFAGIGTAEAVVKELISHAGQAVYRPGSWQRAWLAQALGSDWTKFLEAGDPYGRPDCDQVFQRPSKVTGNGSLPAPAPAPVSRARATTIPKKRKGK